MRTSQKLDPLGFILACADQRIGDSNSDESVACHHSTSHFQNISTLKQQIVEIGSLTGKLLEEDK